MTKQSLPEAATPLARTEPGFLMDATRQLIVSEAVRTFGGKVDLAMVGDSITSNWRWQSSLALLGEGATLMNCGLGGDTTRNLLWRLEHGLLTGFSIRAISLLIGLNNCWDFPSAEEVVCGVRACAQRIRALQPDARIRLYALFPVRGEKLKWLPLIEQINAYLPDVAAEVNAGFCDLGPLFYDEHGEVPEYLMPDGCHPAGEAYDRWAGDLLAWLKQPVL